MSNDKNWLKTCGDLGIKERTRTARVATARSMRYGLPLNIDRSMSASCYLVNSSALLVRMCGNPLLIDGIPGITVGSIECRDNLRYYKIDLNLTDFIGGYFTVKIKTVDHILKLSCQIVSMRVIPARIKSYRII